MVYLALSGNEFFTIRNELLLNCEAYFYFCITSIPTIIPAINMYNNYDDSSYLLIIIKLIISEIE